MKAVEPISHTVKAKGHTAQYRMHKYFARRPYNVFSNLIEHYSETNDIILDCFCGGGVTVFESAKLERRSIGVDINPLATFISRMQMFNGDIDILKNTYSSFIKHVKEKYEQWYHMKFPDDEGICEWVEWAYVVLCPKCAAEIVLVEANKVQNGIYRCPNSICNNTQGVRRVDCKPFTSKPLRVRYMSMTTHQYEVRPITANDIQLDLPIYNDIINDPALLRPNFSIPDNWDRQFEDKLREKGVIEYSDFFTRRNFALNVSIFNDILLLKDKVTPLMLDYLYFLFSSSLRYTNNMTRVTENWEGGKPTAMDKHAFWLPNQYIETNVIDILEKRAKAIINGCTYSKRSLPSTCKEVTDFDELVSSSGGYMVLNQSASELPVPDDSIQVIITDPPYGSNVQYAELSSIWNAWYSLFKNLDNYIYNDEEAVVNRKTKVAGAKTEADYEEVLFKVFNEAGRVLVDDGYLVFTFNNKNVKIWIAMLKAVARAGFHLPENGVAFQDFIKSYKNTSHLRYSGNIHGDFIYSFRKGTKECTQLDFHEHNLQQVIENVIEHEVERMFSIASRYSTTELYQRIFSQLVGVLMDYVTVHLETNEELLKVDSYSNDLIETLLKKALVYHKDYWMMRETS